MPESAECKHDWDRDLTCGKCGISQWVAGMRAGIEEAAKVAERSRIEADRHDIAATIRAISGSPAEAPKVETCSCGARWKSRAMVVEECAKVAEVFLHILTPEEEQEATPAAYSNGTVRRIAAAIRVLAAPTKCVACDTAEDGGFRGCEEHYPAAPTTEASEGAEVTEDTKSHPIIRIREALGLDYPANTEEIIWRIQKITSELARLLVERDQAVADLKHFQESHHLGDKAEKNRKDKDT